MRSLQVVGSPRRTCLGRLLAGWSQEDPRGVLAWLKWKSGGGKRPKSERTPGDCRAAPCSNNTARAHPKRFVIQVMNTIPASYQTLADRFRHLWPVVRSVKKIALIPLLVASFRSTTLGQSVRAPLEGGDDDQFAENGNPQ